MVNIVKSIVIVCAVLILVGCGNSGVNIDKERTINDYSKIIYSNESTYRTVVEAYILNNVTDEGDIDEIDNTLENNKLLMSEQVIAILEELKIIILESNIITEEEESTEYESYSETEETATESLKHKDVLDFINNLATGGFSTEEKTANDTSDSLELSDDEIEYDLVENGSTENTDIIQKEIVETVVVVENYTNVMSYNGNTIYTNKITYNYTNTNGGILIIAMDIDANGIITDINIIN